MKKLIITTLFIGANNLVGMQEQVPMQDISDTDSEIVEIMEHQGGQTSNNSALLQGIKDLDQRRYAKAVKNFKKAAESCDEIAQAEAWYRLGELYRNGKGLARKDPQQARLVWEKASNQFKNKSAQAWSFAQLGDLYLEAEGVDRDLHKAENYLETARAIDLDDKELQSYIEENLEKIAQQRRDEQGIEAIMRETPQELGEAAQRLIVLQSPQPEENNNFGAVAEQLLRLKTPSPVTQTAGAKELELGNNYYVGAATFPQNYVLALKHYTHASDQTGDPYARAAAWLMLADMYSKGLGVEKDPAKARVYYIAASQQDANKFARAVGHMELGMLQQALDYFATLALQSGNNSEQQYARLVLGRHYMQDTPERDLVKARQYLQDVAQCGATAGVKGKATEYLQQLEDLKNKLEKQQTQSSEAFLLAPVTDAADNYNLGMKYYRGDGVPVDLEKARYYLKKAAQQEAYPGIMNIAHQALRQIEQQAKIASAAKRPATAEETSQPKRSREK